MSCGGMCLADPGQARAARCAVCMTSQVGAVARSGPGGGYGVPVGYPNPYGASERVEAQGLADFPAPQVTSREGVGCDWPGPVMTLDREARACDWSVSRGYARGRFPNLATGRPGVERESFSVRFARQEWQGYAVFVNRVWQSIWVAGRGLAPFGWLGRKELGAWLMAPSQEPEWYQEIRRRKMAQAYESKAKAAARPKKAKSEGM